MVVLNIAIMITFLKDCSPIWCSSCKWEYKGGWVKCTSCGQTVMTRALSQTRTSASKLRQNYGIVTLLTKVSKGITAGNDEPNCAPHHFFIQTLWVRTLQQILKENNICDIITDVFINRMVSSDFMEEMEERQTRRIKGLKRKP